MHRLYAPWRSAYVRKKEDGPCVFCAAFAQTNDAENFILRRYSTTIVMLNRYPYNAGHVMVLPTSHIATIKDCSQETRLELMNVTNLALEVLQTVLKPQGANVGINFGGAAGGSQPGHLHIHALPRWNGDTNFLAALADTKPISLDLREIYSRLRPEFERASL